MSETLPVSFDVAPDQPISTDIALYGGVFAKRHVIPKAGTYVPQHSHGYDHLSLLASGAMRAWCDDKLVGNFKAPAEIRIPAGTKHTFLALTDETIFYCIHNADAFEEDECHELPGLLKPGSVDRGDGIVFAREELDTFLSEDGHLFEAHCISVGERPNEWQDKNWALMKRMQAQGYLHLTTARRQGVLLGYLMALVSPMLYALDSTEGLHTLFYTDPKVPGLGLRLQRASIEFLRGVGVDNVILRAGHRGNGPRLTALYERLGAKPVGRLFAIHFKGPE